MASQPGDAADPGYGMGVTAGDYDNDGDVDLYVTNWGPNVLLRNDGGGRFEDVTKAAGVGDPGWGTAAAFLDLDRDDDLDLFVVNYLSWSPGSAQDCVRTYCGPTVDDATADRLYRNNGDGTFADSIRERGTQHGVRQRVGHSRRGLQRGRSCRRVRGQRRYAEPTVVERHRPRRTPTVSG